MPRAIKFSDGEKILIRDNPCQYFIGMVSLLRRHGINFKRRCILCNSKTCKTEIHRPTRICSSCRAKMKFAHERKIPIKSLLAIQLENPVYDSKKENEL